MGISTRKATERTPARKRASAEGEAAPAMEPRKVGSAPTPRGSNFAKNMLEELTSGDGDEEDDGGTEFKDSWLWRIAEQPADAIFPTRVNTKVERLPAEFFLSLGEKVRCNNLRRPPVRGPGGPHHIQVLPAVDEGQQSANGVCHLQHPFRGEGQTQRVQEMRVALSYRLYGARAVLAMRRGRPVLLGGGGRRTGAQREEATEGGRRRTTGDGGGG